MKKRKRTAIFPFYHKQGRLTNDVEFLIKSLKQIADTLVVVSNGQLEDRSKMEQLADILIVRENRGYDAGAYKEALFNEEVSRVIDEAQELVFCNDTFYGPFIPFQLIFEEMDDPEVDFWGLNLSDTGLSTFLQSYFLVFKKEIWKNGDLKKFFEENIDENTLDFNKVLMSFEQNIFSFLVDKGYHYNAFRVQRYHIFTDFEGSICLDRLPILKKKVLSKQYYDRERLLDVLHYIDGQYNYDIRLILEDLKERNSITLSHEEIKRHKVQIKAKEMIVTKTRKEDIVKFVQRHKRVYIYGIGGYGKAIKNMLKDESVAGFIVSDDHLLPDEGRELRCSLGDKQQESFDKIPLYGISELKSQRGNLAPIIVALSEKNKVQVQSKLKSFPNVLYLF